MKNLSIEQLLKEKPAIEESHVGLASRNNIRKEGTVYHVIITSWRKKRLFDAELAQYRKDLLHEECINHGVSILFSVTMPTHTHDVFITPDWETLSHVIKMVNSNVAKFVRRHMPDKIKNRRYVFSSDPAYVMVENINQLFFLGKYVYNNYSYQKSEGKQVPDSCFWMFEKNYFSEPYDSKLYQKLFRMEPKSLLEFYATHTDADVKEFAGIAFNDWTDEDNRRVFIRQK